GGQGKLRPACVGRGRHGARGRKCAGRHEGIQGRRPKITPMRLLQAIRNQPVDCTPIWFMRQAGRYMPEYRALRLKHSILEICRTAELAAEVTLQPIRKFPGLDAAIIFSDILLLTEPMGIHVEFVKNEGPAIQNPVATEADVAALRAVEPEKDLP